MATRMQQLAHPKPNRLRYPDRRSVYWLDELPPERRASTTEIELTPRWSNLCRGKKFYTQVTVSPIWEVSEWALRAVASERLCCLAQPRGTAAGWKTERPLLVPLGRATQTAIATSRICQLAQPKRRLLEGPGHKPKPAPPAHSPSKATAHIELLASESSFTVVSCSKHIVYLFNCSSHQHQSTTIPSSKGSALCAGLFPDQQETT
ncbi:theg spermatid protein isoform X2 [Mugil cephalus]|uniref:theg spermatid protein isoform X2 n=1 Tax=Mugil cephalus TaxID=48193 RepID=UPI001FB6198C|nr:theg spermatid protein isoform X2 [Mugil cephalus]